MAAVALLDDGHAGRAYNLTGPEALTPRRRIEVLSRAVGRDIAFGRPARTFARWVAEHAERFQVPRVPVG